MTSYAEPAMTSAETAAEFTTAVGQRLVDAADPRNASRPLPHQDDAGPPSPFQLSSPPTVLGVSVDTVSFILIGVGAAAPILLLAGVAAVLRLRTLRRRRRFSKYVFSSVGEERSAATDAWNSEAATTGAAAGGKRSSPAASTYGKMSSSDGGSGSDRTPSRRTATSTHCVDTVDHRPPPPITDADLREFFGDHRFADDSPRLTSSSSSRNRGRSVDIQNVIVTVAAGSEKFGDGNRPTTNSLSLAVTVDVESIPNGGGGEGLTGSGRRRRNDYTQPPPLPPTADDDGRRDDDGDEDDDADYEVGERSTERRRVGNLRRPASGFNLQRSTACYDIAALAKIVELPEDGGGTTDPLSSSLRKIDAVGKTTGINPVDVISANTSNDDISKISPRLQTDPATVDHPETTYDGVLHDPAKTTTTPTARDVDLLAPRGSVTAELSSEEEQVLKCLDAILNNYMDYGDRVVNVDIQDDGRGASVDAVTAV